MKKIKTFFKNKKLKKSTYFYMKYSNSIGLYQKDYERMRELLPFHSVEKTGEYSIIQLSCPLRSYYTYKKFYHFGDRFDFKYLKEKNALPVETWRSEIDKGFHCDVANEGDNPLPEDFNPCSLCKNELSCIFSATKLNFQPKEYDTLYLLDILKENRFVESEVMYHRFLAYYDEEYGYYSEFADATWKDVAMVFIVILPLALLYLPFHFLWMFIDSLKEKFKPSTDS